MTGARVAIIPHGKLGNDAIFEVASSRDNCLERFHLLRRALHNEGIACRTVDRFLPAEIDLLVFQDIHKDLGVVLRTVKANPYVRLVYLAVEPQTVLPLHDEGVVPELPVDAVLTWNDRIVGSAGVIKANIGEPAIRADEIPYLPFREKKLISCICANKSSRHPASLYGERLKAIEFFSSQPEGIDLFGVGWERSGNPAVRLSYRGKCECKRDVLRNYRFSLAYENTLGFPGLITEKIFDCFAAGTVPVYYGAPNVTDYIPHACFVDFRGFRGYPELRHFLATMAEKGYARYLEAAADFIDSAGYREFTAARFAEIAVGEIKRTLDGKGSYRTPAGLKRELLRLIFINPGVLRNPRPFRRLLLDMATSW